MKIEIAEPGRMTQSGSSLLRLIQNNDMPLLDLFVRESVQNCLDAHLEGVDSVCVDFLSGYFESDAFLQYLDGVKDVMEVRFPEKRYRFLAVRDSRTTGLTGPLHYKDVIGNDYGNLLKLIYEISKPQQNEGAGGSWGLGKTVYFRIGIGMVMYYSRIRENGTYRSRLAVSMVEDETKDESIIPRFNGMAKRGIAWWGESVPGEGNNDTQPLQDEKTICRILRAFSIDPYENDETGTTIVIPYIDDQKLLDSNRIEYETVNGTRINPAWRRTVEDYLLIAIQRWYAPRLWNSAYQYGPALHATVNRKRCTVDGEPFFMILQSLYNAASAATKNEDRFENGIEIHVREINTRRLLERSCAGRVAFAKISEATLLELPPNNKPLPYVYANKELHEGSSNPPLITFCRKPGMIVSYETNSNWADGIDKTVRGEYIIAFFVLDSAVRFKKETCGNLSLEEYIRRAELADHASWKDMTLVGCSTASPRIVQRIQKGVSKEISKQFAETPVVQKSRTNVGLGKLFGDLLLPPVNFGHLPSVGGGSSGGGNDTQSFKGIKLTINQKKIVYNRDGTIDFPLSVTVPAGSSTDTNRLVMTVAMDTSPITAAEWEEWTDKQISFNIQSFFIKGYTAAEKNIEQTFDEDTEEIAVGDCTLAKLRTGSGRWYGLSLTCSESHDYTLKGTVRVASKDRVLKMGFKPIPGR